MTRVDHECLLTASKFSTADTAEVVEATKFGTADNSDRERGSKIRENPWASRLQLTKITTFLDLFRTVWVDKQLIIVRSFARRTSVAFGGSVDKRETSRCLAGL